MAKVGVGLGGFQVQTPTGTKKMKREKSFVVSFELHVLYSSM